MLLLVVIVVLLVVVVRCGGVNNRCGSLSVCDVVGAANMLALLGSFVVGGGGWGLIVGGVVGLLLW